MNRVLTKEFPCDRVVDLMKVTDFFIYQKIVYPFTFVVTIVGNFSEKTRVDELDFNLKVFCNSDCTIRKLV